METTVEQLIAERSYDSLNDSEKSLVAELCANEQEFNRMQQFFVSVSGVSSVESYEPSSGLKSSLDSVFAAKHGGIGARLTPREVTVARVAKVIPLYRQTWARVAAGIILLAGVFSIWQLSGSGTFRPETKEIALAEEQSRQTESKMEAVAEQEQEQDIAKSGNYSEPRVKTRRAEEERMEPEPVLMYDYLNSDAPYSDKSLKTFSETEFGSTADEAFSKMKNGIDADLYPNGRKDVKGLTGESASAVSASQEDLLSYIVPAF